MQKETPYFSDTINIGISQCLLGENVRHDGGHKRSFICTEILAKHFNFIAVCPEMGIGMGSPREAIHLAYSPQKNAIRAVGNSTDSLDVTHALAAYAQEKSRELAQIHGYIFMGRSPSCGLGSVKIYAEDGGLINSRATGIYAHAFTQCRPLLPTEEESCLHGAVVLENFVTRVYAYKRWCDLLAKGLSASTLQSFHARHKYLLMAHSPLAYQTLGRLVAQAHQRPAQEVEKMYGREFMAALGKICTTQGHTNVLQHLLGYFKKNLSAEQKKEAGALIENYRLGHMPLSAPLLKLKSYLENNPNNYLKMQVYFEPYPSAISLKDF